MGRSTRSSCQQHEKRQRTHGSEELGDTWGWEATDTVLALKSGDRRPLIDRTTATNHAKIEAFLSLLATIPRPAR
jgi:hypothetical protein